MTTFVAIILQNQSVTTGSRRVRHHSSSTFGIPSVSFVSIECSFRLPALHGHGVSVTVAHQKGDSHQVHSVLTQASNGSTRLSYTSFSFFSRSLPVPHHQAHSLRITTNQVLHLPPPIPSLIHLPHHSINTSSPTHPSHLFRLTQLPPERPSTTPFPSLNHTVLFHSANPSVLFSTSLGP
jgi:hypothetical protein